MSINSSHMAGLLLLAASGFATASDSFSGAPTLAINSQTDYNTTANTREPGEPADLGEHTTWYRYVAPTRGIVRIDLTASLAPGSGSGYAYLDVFHGNTLAGLNRVSDDYGSSAATVSFPAEAGAEFRICISDARAAVKHLGKITIQQSSWPHGSAPLIAPVLSTTGQPANDEFTSPQLIPSGPSVQTVMGYNISATQSGFGPEPVRTGYRTLWYRWTAPRRGIARITTNSRAGVGYGHRATIFRGNSVTALNGVASHGQSWWSNNLNCAFPVEAGVEYRISFGGYDDDDRGPFVFNLGLEAWPYGTSPIIAPRMPTGDVPRNDLVEGATLLTSKRGKYIALDYNLSATTGMAPLEPTVTGYRSLWYRWTAPETSYVAFSTPGYQSLGYYHSLTAFTGSQSNLTKLSEIYTYGAPRMGFYATKGKTYYICFGTNSSATTEGRVIFTYESGPAVNPSGPKMKITNLKKNTKVSKNGFYIQATIGTDPEGVKAAQVRVRGKVVASGDVRNLNISVVSGKVKKGKVKVEVRAQDGFGRWGNWTGVTVNAS